METAAAGTPATFRRGPHSPFETYTRRHNIGVYPLLASYRSGYQAITPDRMLGRVNASIRFIGMGMLLLGSLLGGALAETIGLRWTLVVGAGSGVLGAIWLMLSPMRGIKEAPLLTDEPTQNSSQ